MKKFALSIIILIAGICVQAQPSAPVKLAKLTDPLTNCEYRYYYFPNIEAYFDTQKSLYYFKDNGAWTTAKEIPSGYRGYSMYNKVAVLITDYDGDEPTQNLSANKKKYPYNMHGKYKELTASTE